MKQNCFKTLYFRNAEHTFKLSKLQTRKLVFLKKHIYVLHANICSRQENMPNAFGKADLFGRKRDVGTTSVIYLGLNGSNAVFLRRDVDISSSKTTMNSSPSVINQSSTSYHTGNVGGTSYSGTSTTYNAPIFLPPNTPQDRITGIREMEITIAILGENNFALIAGTIMELVSADNNQVVFKLSDPE